MEKISDQGAVARVDIGDQLQDRKCILGALNEAIRCRDVKEEVVPETNGANKTNGSPTKNIVKGIRYHDLPAGLYIFLLAKYHFGEKCDKGDEKRGEIHCYPQFVNTIHIFSLT